MTLRQIWVRINALPYDSPYQAALREAKAQAESAEKAAAHDNALAAFLKTNQG